MDWAESKYIPSLLIASFLALLGSLVRYEVWMMLVAGMIYVFLTAFHHAQEHKLKRAEGYTILFMALACFGLVLWFLYNYLGWNDPLYFLNGQFSAKSQQLNFDNKGLLSTKYNLALSFKVFLSNILENLGGIVSLLAVLALGFILVRKDIFYRKFFYVVILAPVFFIFLSLFFGITIMYTQFFPLPGTHQLFNVRYGILSLIPATILISIMVKYLSNFVKFRWVVYCISIVLITLNYYRFYSLGSYAVLEDGRTGLSAFGKNNEANISAAITKSCNEGLTLISAGQNDTQMFEANLPMKSFVYEGSGKYWQEAIKNPDKIVLCIVTTKNDSVYKELVKNPVVFDKYVIVYNSDNDTLIYKKITNNKSAQKQNVISASLGQNKCEYVVTPGDSLWGIAKSKFGNGKEYSKIIKLNSQVANPRLIHPDQKLSIPCFTRT